MTMHGEPVKVLQLQPNFDVATTYVGEQISQALDGKEYSVTTAYLRESEIRGLDDSLEKKYCFRFSKRSLKGVFRWYSIWRLYRYIKKNEFSIIIVHRFKAIHMLLLLSRLLKIPVVGIVHGMGDYDRKYRQNFIKSWVTEKCSFVAVSSEVKKYLVNMSCGFINRNTHVITNAIDIESIHKEQLSRNDAREALGVSQDAFIFGAIGRLVPAKGYEYLIKAMTTLGAVDQEIQLVIVGDGRLRVALQSLIELYGLEKKIKLVGWREQAAKYVRAFDVFVISSLSEGMPLAMMEAMSGKVPVIASNIPSLELLIEGSGSWSFQPANERELASIMRKVLIMNEGNLNEVGEQAYSYISKNHSLEDFCSGYNALVASQLALNS
jgi:glycosyltransferase involved in cell wall biosynthesis